MMTSSMIRPIRRCLFQRNQRNFSSSWWINVPMGPKDPILGVTERYNADKSPKKLNLGVGAYRDNNGKPVVLKSVQEASARIHNASLNNEYGPISGDASFVKNAVTLAYGEDNPIITKGRYAAVQSLSGTGALYLMGKFIKRFGSNAQPRILLPTPTWGNHIPIFTDAGLIVERYPYYDANTKGLDIDGIMKSIDDAPTESFFLFHACAHNPTGCDPTEEQWKMISQRCKQKNHFVVVDSAYQGFASGNLRKDANAVHQFLQDGHNIALCQSFAKNFGLYGQRVGCLSIVTSDAEEAKRVESQLKILARPVYSNPPIHGARIVTTILNDPELNEQWLADVKEMADRIITMRELLRKELEACGSTLDWSHVTSQIGMFCYTGMTKQQVDNIVNNHHVYLTPDGRISMAGVTTRNVKYLAQAIHDVTK